MGYSYRGEIKDFWPDDTDDEMWIASIGGESLEGIIEQAKKKWPDASFENLIIEAKHVHTECLGYDLHDSSDYTDFIKISRRKSE